MTASASQEVFVVLTVSHIVTRSGTLERRGAIGMDPLIATHKPTADA